MRTAKKEPAESRAAGERSGRIARTAGTRGPGRHRPGFYEVQIRAGLVLAAAAEGVDARQPRRRVSQDVRKQPARAAPLPAAQLQGMQRHRAARSLPGLALRAAAAVLSAACGIYGIQGSVLAAAVECAKPAEAPKDGHPVAQVAREPVVRQLEFQRRPSARPSASAEFVRLI